MRKVDHNTMINPSLFYSKVDSKADYNVVINSFLFDSKVDSKVDHNVVLNQGRLDVFGVLFIIFLSSYLSALFVFLS